MRRLSEELWIALIVLVLLLHDLAVCGDLLGIWQLPGYHVRALEGDRLTPLPTTEIR